MDIHRKGAAFPQVSKTLTRTIAAWLTTAAWLTSFASHVTKKAVSTILEI